MILLQVSSLALETTHNLAVGQTMHPFQIMQPQQWREQKNLTATAYWGPSSLLCYMFAKEQKEGILMV